MRLLVDPCCAVRVSGAYDHAARTPRRTGEAQSLRTPAKPLAANVGFIDIIQSVGYPRTICAATQLWCIEKVLLNPSHATRQKIAGQ